MKKALVLCCLLPLPLAHAETAPTAPQPVTTPPSVSKPAATTVAPAAPKPATTAPARPPAPRSVTPALVPGAVVAAPAQAAPLTPEQRRQIDLLANAERIDKANRELLARTQELQLQNENLGMQLNIIRHDKSSEGIWKGAIAVVAGFLMGWFFATSSRRKSSW